MAAVYPGAHNVFIRDHDASNKMVVDFARNVKKFAVNRYVQVVPVEKVGGYYLRMTVEEAGRILNDQLEDVHWPDAAPAPEGNEGTETHEWFPYRTIRRAFPFLLGDLTIEQASWNILAQHSSIQSRRAMTARTQLAINTLTTQANYATGHYSAVSSISGNTGTWAQSTTARQDIKRSLHYAAEKILDDTLAGVEIDDLILVVSSGLASKMSLCQEIVDYIKGSPDALAQVRGELPGENTMYGLPNKIYGFPIVVEKTRKTTTKKGATTSKSSILSDSTAFMVARPGGLVGVADAPNFSTCVVFAQEEMTVETLRDAPNRRTMGRVVENIAVEMVAPTSGFLFTSAS